MSAEPGVEGYVPSAQLGCRSRAACLGLAVAGAAERAEPVPARAAAEECCELGEFYLFSSGTKQGTSEFLLLGERRWGNGGKWTARPPCQRPGGNVV